MKELYPDKCRHQTIMFNGQEFPVRVISLPGIQDDAMIATLSLQKQLLTEDLENHVSDEARIVDNLIFFFVEDNQIDLPTSALSRIIIKNSGLKK